MLVRKDEQLKKSPPYLGHLILKKLSSSTERKVFVQDVPVLLKDELGYINHRNFIFTLLFLYQAGLIKFQEPYILNHD